METTSIVPSLVDVPARLSSAQKRDLLGQALAAVITTALIAAPLLAPPPGSVDVSSEPTLPAQSFAGAVSAVPAQATATRPLARSRASRARVRAEGTLVANVMPRMAMLPASVGTRGSAAAVEDAVPERTADRKPLSRKLTTWLTGDGTLSVRPFPTVAARQ